MRIIITIVLMAFFNGNANAGWFDFWSSKPKTLTAKEMAMVKRGICGCAIGNGEWGVPELMNEMNISLRKTYNIHGSFTCKGWDSYYPQIEGRTACINVYNNFGEDRALKTRGASVK